MRGIIDVSKRPVSETAEIEGIGKVNLRIIVDSEGVNPQKRLSLVRDAGMMITDKLGNMRRTPSQSMITFPRSWNGFTAIVECLSENSRSLLREAEGPRHDAISPDYADESERQFVSNALTRLGEWVRDSIEKHAKPPEPADSANASEMAEFLPLDGSGNEGGLDPRQRRFEITEPIQNIRPPRSLVIPGRNKRRKRETLPGGDEPAPGDVKEKGKGTRKKKNRQLVEIAFDDVRRLPSRLTQWPKHTARFTFDVPQNLPRRIRLYAAGEDGRPEQIQIERAYVNQHRISVKRGDITGLGKHGIRGDRIEIEVKAIRPISNRRLEIRST